MSLSKSNQTRLAQNEKAQKKFFGDNSPQQQIKEWLEEANIGVGHFCFRMEGRFTFTKKFADEQYYYTLKLSTHKEFRDKFQTWHDAYSQFLFYKERYEYFDCNSIHLSKDGFQFRQGADIRSTGGHEEIINDKINRFEYAIVFVEE
mgnify:CR=1 FL=1